MNPPKRSPWPYAIVAYFIIFAGAIAVWIVYAVNQKVDLVRDDYYEEEIRFQERLNRLNHTEAIRDRVSIAYNPSDQVIAIKLPLTHVLRDGIGEIRLYRPSDARLDLRYQLSVDTNGIQRIDATHLRAGLWKAGVSWKGAGQDYLFEQALVLGPSRL